MLELDDWLDKLDIEWHFLYGQNNDFESMDYDTQEEMYHRGLSIEEAIMEYKKQRTFKCLKCQHYDVKVVNDKGATIKVCNVKANDPRTIVDLDAPNCIEFKKRPQS